MYHQSPMTFLEVEVPLDKVCLDYSRTSEPSGKKGVSKSEISITLKSSAYLKI